jgi:hypothetical protein
MSNDNDPINGVQILLDEIEEELSNKRISKRDRLYLRSNQYILKSLIPIREDVHTLKNHDAIAWAAKNPKGAWILGISLFMANSMINWSGLRKPILQGLIHFTTGIMLPLDSLP